MTNDQVPNYIVAPLLETLLARQNLAAETAVELAQAIMTGRVAPASLGAILIALRAKGESVEELAAFAQVMRASAIKVEAPPDTLDTCGTGGDKSGAFNISTAAALVVAGICIPVAKHGGRAVSSGVGSADVLKALGVNIEVQPACVARCIKEAGIGFMFAPSHHPSMKQVAPTRKELGVRTIFNLLGPLSNPAGAKRQLIGVCDRIWCEKIALTLKLLGSESALVVCGVGPGGVGCLDEVSTFGPTTIARLKNDVITMEEFRPETLGLVAPKADALRVKNADDSATIIHDTLNGARSPARDITLLNAAAAALVAGKAASWQDGLALAARSIDEGHARAALEKLIHITNEIV